VTTDRGRGALGPRALHADSPRRAVARFGEAPLPAPFATGVCTGNEAQGTHELPGRVEATEVPQCGHQGDGGNELDPAPRMDGRDHWRPAPGLDQGREFGCHALPPLGLLGHRPDVLLADNLLGGGRTDPLG
jgi:hypothetical protein